MNTDKKPLTLLIHTNMALEWCKATAAELYRQSLNSCFSLKIVYRYQDITSADGPIILLSVDRLWITENIQRLEKSGHKVILLSGVIERSAGNVSRIIMDYDDLIQKSVIHLQQCGCSSIAFFGAQKNDTSDACKAESFAKLISAEHVYRITQDLEECFDRLSNHLSEYDGVICANDILAVYLLERCRKLGIQVPDDLRIVGNGNLWIAANTTPAITTISTEINRMAAITLRLCRDFYQFKEIASVDVYIKSSLIPRTSTGCTNLKMDNPVSLKVPRLLYEEKNTDKELIAIQRIDRTLSSLSSEKLQLLRRYVKGETYGSIAEQMHISEDTLKYHIKKIYKALHVHSKEECILLLKQYLGG